MHFFMEQYNSKFNLFGKIKVSIVFISHYVFHAMHKINLFSKFYSNILSNEKVSSTRISVQQESLDDNVFYEILDKRFIIKHLEASNRYILDL